MKTYSTNQIREVLRTDAKTAARTLSKNGIAPYKISKTAKRTMCFWGQDAMDFAMELREEMDARHVPITPAPVEAILPEPQEEKSISNFNKDGLDITVIETNKMMDVLTAIDEKLATLIKLWEK